MRDVAAGRVSRGGAMLSVFVLAFAVVVLSACNTTAGVGEDVSAAGRAVTKGADKVKQGL